MKRPKGSRVIQGEEKQRRLRVVVTDEDTGECVAMATGVETMALLVAPDTLRGEDYRRVVGDTDLVQSLLLDTLDDVMEWSGNEALLDLGDLLKDLLEEAVEDLPVH
jgi:hypothetical protein